MSACPLCVFTGCHFVLFSTAITAFLWSVCMFPQHTSCSSNTPCNSCCTFIRVLMHFQGLFASYKHVLWQYLLLFQPLISEASGCKGKCESCETRNSVFGKYLLLYMYMYKLSCRIQLYVHVWGYTIVVEYVHVHVLPVQCSIGNRIMLASASQSSFHCPCCWVLSIDLRALYSVLHLPLLSLSL